MIHGYLVGDTSKIECPYCDGGRKSPSTDDRTECGFCEDGVLVVQEWWAKRGIR